MYVVYYRVSVCSVVCLCEVSVSVCAHNAIYIGHYSTRGGARDWDKCSGVIDESRE